MVRRLQAAVQSPFWQGFALGVLVMAAGCGGMMWQLSREGLRISLDTGTLAARVEAEVREHIRQELPALLGRVRRDLPPLVAARVAEWFRGERVDLGPVEVALPPGVAEELSRRLAASLAEAVDEMIRRVNAEQVAGQVAQEARGLVQARIARVLAGWQPSLRLLPWLTIPITVQPG